MFRSHSGSEAILAQATSARIARLRRPYRLLQLQLAAMAKSKNHTGHNQIYKNHRNGIKKQRRPRKMSMEGMNCRFVRNQAFAKRGMKCTDDEKAQRLAAQKEALRELKDTVFTFLRII